jgi:hypothetical protein
MIPMVLLGCGRIAFEPLDSVDGADGGDKADASTDAMTAISLTTVGSAESFTGSVTLPNVTLAGSDRLIVVTHRVQFDTVSVTWAGQQLSRDEPIPAWGSGPSFVSIWSRTVPDSGTGNIVENGASASPGLMVAIVVKGLQPSAIDQRGSNSGIGSVATATTAGETTAPRELVLAVAGGNAGTMFTGTWDPAYTLVDTRSSLAMDLSVAYRVVSSIGSFGATFSGFTPREWCGVVATYKAE